jgi:hypothetical protein
LSSPCNFRLTKFTVLHVARTIVAEHQVQARKQSSVFLLRGTSQAKVGFSIVLKIQFEILDLIRMFSFLFFQFLLQISDFQLQIHDFIPQFLLHVLVLQSLVSSFWVGCKERKKAPMVQVREEVINQEKK